MADTNPCPAPASTTLTAPIHPPEPSASNRTAQPVLPCLPAAFTTYPFALQALTRRAHISTANPCSATISSGLQSHSLLEASLALFLPPGQTPLSSQSPLDIALPFPEHIVLQ